MDIPVKMHCASYVYALLYMAESHVAVAGMQIDCQCAEDFGIACLQQSSHNLLKCHKEPYDTLPRTRKGCI